MFNLKEAAEHGVNEGTNFASYTLTEMDFRGKLGEGFGEWRYSYVLVPRRIPRTHELISARQNTYTEAERIEMTERVSDLGSTGRPLYHVHV